MKTLREAGLFAGIQEDSGEFGTSHPISLGYIRYLLTGSPFNGSLNIAYPYSMQNAIQVLQSFPDIQLDARIVGPSESYEPYAPLMGISASTGKIISTKIFYESGGILYDHSTNLGATGGEYGAKHIGPGSWTLKVKRAGIGKTGYQKLEKRLHVLCLQPPVPEEPQVPVYTRPTIWVTHEIKNRKVTFTVKGKDFLADQPDSPQGITIRLVDEYNIQLQLEFHTKSDSNGKIEVISPPFDLDLFTINPDFLNRKVNLSATDKRRDPNSVPVNDPFWSNTEKIVLTI